ncbi:MAG: hypothetical protein Q9184_002680 [Pyrenodesmia sp. 2 TL-2023]
MSPAQEVAGIQQHTPSAFVGFAQVMAMSTTLFDPMLLQDMKFVVYWRDCCLAGYHEINFIAPSLKIRVVHVVNQDDPRCADMNSLAHAVANETQRSLFNRAAADNEVARGVKALTGRDDDAWWRTIVTENRRARAEREAHAVVKKHEDISRIDQATKERLASLVNNETIDLLYLESFAGTKDEQGNRPSITSLRAQRRAETRQALLLGESQSAQRKLIAQLESKEAERERQTEDLTATDRQKDAVTEAPESSNSSTDTVGKPDNTTVYTTNAGVISVERTNGVEGSLAEDDAVAADGTIPGILVPYPTDTSAVSASEDLSWSRRNSSSSKGSSLAGQPPVIMTPACSPIIQDMDIVQENTTNARQPDSNLQQPAESYQRTLQPSLRFTLADIVTANHPIHVITRAPYQGTNTGSSQGIPSVRVGSAFSQGPQVSSQDTAKVNMASSTLHSSHHNVSTGQQNIPISSIEPYLTAFPRGWNNIKWAYRTHTPADSELQALGIWLFERPATSQTHHVSDPAIQQHSQIVIAPPSQGRNMPSYTSDGQTLVLYPHSTPWHNDPRSAQHTDAVTPNFIPETRLAEYQAVEALGYQVWRHDRDYLQCANLACQKILSDIRNDTLLCLGCGPHTTIRYCSRACKVLDSYRHGQDCGMPHHLIPTVVDEGTAPPRFSHLFPALRNRHGIRTYETHRQRTYAEITDGRYTLFNPSTEEPTTIVWDWLFNGREEYPYQGYGAEMEARIERCLNLALFDQYQTMVVEYLFRLLQQALHIKGAPQAIARVLVDQFAKEFGFIAQASWRITSGEPICECEWAGDAVLAYQHTMTCSSRYRVQGELFRGGKRCLKDLVEAMEAKYWILRAWRTQHPVEQDWQRRVMGHGFPGCVVPAGWTPKFGKGWVGNWAAEDDVCG